jgi:class 3 adenylate cyclase
MCPAEPVTSALAVGGRSSTGDGILATFDGGVGGIAVHLAARVMATAGSGEILVSRTVRDLVAGPNITMEDHGSQVLKGIEGTWRLFAVTRA